MMIAATGHGISAWDPPSRRHSARPAECTFSVSTSADFVRTAWGVDDFSGRFRSSARTHLAHSAFHEWGVHDNDADIVMDLTAVAIVAIPTCTSALLGREPLFRAIASLLDLSLSALPPCLLPSRGGDLRRPPQAYDLGGRCSRIQLAVQHCRVSLFQSFLVRRRCPFRPSFGQGDG